ncbi:MAG: hypothetical protein JWL88_3 [Parcubacteria group bacterium]|nr:hypothetical protein [Parcubacteria group bacterium]
MNGMTLIELLIVIALASVLTSLSIGMGIQEFEQTLAHANGTRMTTIARHARAQSMHGTSRNLYWASKFLIVAPQSGGQDESYIFSENETGIATGSIRFLGPARLNDASSLQIGTWETAAGTAGSIDLNHSQ